MSNHVKDNVKVTLTYEVPTSYYSHPHWWADPNFKFDASDISSDFGYMTGIDFTYQANSLSKKIKYWIGI